MVRLAHRGTPDSDAVTGLLPLRETRARRRSLPDWLWLLGIGAVQWPWLLRSLSPGSARVRAQLLERLQWPADALPALGSWRADAHFLSLLAEHVARTRPGTVVELGAGATTLVLARALALHGDGRLISFDQHPPFLDALEGQLAALGLTAELRHAPLTEAGSAWPGLWYATDALPERIDLLVIDGPPWPVHPLVRGHADALFGRLAVGGTVMLDDAARPGERLVAARWRRRWPGFRFRRVGGPAGTLIGERLR